jgi:KDO2-lipid IV(A) lauroyltransferase
MKRVTYILFLFFIYAFSFTPFRILYVFSDYILFPFFFYIYRYRRKIILQNLQHSFPEKSPEELRRIMRAFYHHFCDLLVEGVKAFSMSEKQVLERYKLMNPEFLAPYAAEKKSVIAVLGHYNNWEWGSIAAGLQLTHLPVALYKPLSNKLIDNYIERTRAKGGTILLSIFQTTHSFEKYRDIPAIFLMVADQSPSHTEKSIWVPFLNQDTPVLHGPEKHARLSNLPVVFIDVQKIKRGFYQATLRALVEDPQNTADGEITSRYMQALEAQIRKRPEFWLWSHNRWKHKRQKTA